jgi:hypothetical protein
MRSAATSITPVTWTTSTFNPVKHGYVTFARDWPYSTFNRLVKAGLYAADWRDAGAADMPAGEASTQRA